MIPNIIIQPWKIDDFNLQKWQRKCIKKFVDFFPFPYLILLYILGLSWKNQWKTQINVKSTIGSIFKIKISFGFAGKKNLNGFLYVPLNINRGISSAVNEKFVNRMQFWIEDKGRKIAT